MAVHARAIQNGINSTLPSDVHPEHIMVRWTGKLKIDQAGEYVLHTVTQHAVTQHAVALSISATARQVQCSSSPVCTILRFYGLSIREIKNFGCFGNHLPETRPTFQRHSCFMTAVKCRQLLHQQAVRRGSAHFRSRTMETSMNHAQSLQTIPSGAGRHFILRCCMRLMLL